MLRRTSPRLSELTASGRMPALLASAPARQPAPSSPDAEEAGDGPRGALAAAGEVESGRTEARPLDRGAGNPAASKVSGSQVLAGRGGANNEADGDQPAARGGLALRRGSKKKLRLEAKAKTRPYLNVMRKAPRVKRTEE